MHCAAAAASTARAYTVLLLLLRTLRCCCCIHHKSVHCGFQTGNRPSDEANHIPYRKSKPTGHSPRAKLEEHGCKQEKNMSEHTTPCSARCHLTLSFLNLAIPEQRPIVSQSVQVSLTLTEALSDTDCLFTALFLRSLVGAVGSVSRIAQCGCFWPMMATFQSWLRPNHCRQCLNVAVRARRSAQKECTPANKSTV